eukprot:COSAG01_NODE_3208_length_6417_cov_23.948876_1_plen_286_part_00
MVGGQIKGRNAKNLAETPASSAERRRCAISTIAVSLFCNDQARGNFAYQSDQELALALCGGNSVRTVQMQTYVTSASAIAQFASNQLVGRLCDSCGRRPLLIGMPLLMALLRLCVVARPCWPTLFTAELASYMMFQVQMTPIEAALGDLYPEADALAKASSRVYSIKVSRGSRKLLAGIPCNLLPTLSILHPRHLLMHESLMFVGVHCRVSPPSWGHPSVFGWSRSRMGVRRVSRALRGCYLRYCALCTCPRRCRRRRCCYQHHYRHRRNPRPRMARHQAAKTLR